MSESKVTGAVAEPARRVHERSVVILTHVHEIFERDFARMASGGISGAFVVSTVDGRMYAETDVWLDSLASDAGLLADTLSTLDYVHWLATKPNPNVLIALEGADFARAKREGKVALLLGCEGSRFLEGRLEVLRAVYRLGMRYIAPMWFYDCAVGTAQDTTSHEGLTGWGLDLIREANRLGILVDANHFSPRSLLDALEVSEKPLIVSHTGARALHPQARQLLDDELLKAVADADGVLGLMFQSFIIKPGHDKASIDDLVRQFAYCAELVGTDHLACGTDYLYNDPRLWGGNNPTGASPGPITWPEGLEHPGKLPNLTEALLESGFDEDDVEKMLGGNVIRLFEQVRRGSPTLATGDYSEVGDESRVGIRTGGLTPA